MSKAARQRAARSKAANEEHRAPLCLISILRDTEAPTKQTGKRQDVTTVVTTLGIPTSSYV